jgi:hypothetical protein
MNLPQSALEFLDTFIGYSRRFAKERKIISLPIIHVYSFSTEKNPVLDVAQRAADIMNCTLVELGTGIISTQELGIKGVCDSKDLNLINSSIYDKQLIVGHIVRDVAPQKAMVCLSFQLPQSVAEAVPVVSIPPRQSEDSKSCKRPREEE